MKKLLTVSVLAIMAVSTANAEIASTGFVTDRTGTVTGTAFDSLSEDEKNLTGAINAIAGKVGNVDAQIEEAIENATIEQGQVSGLDTALAGKADSATTLSGYGITDAYTKTEVDGKVANMEVTTNRTSDITESLANGNSTAYPTVGAVKDYLDDRFTLNEYSGEEGVEVDNINHTITLTDNAVDGKKLKDDTIDGGKLKDDTVTSAKLAPAVRTDIAKGVAADTLSQQNKAAIEALPTTYASKTTVETAYQNAIDTAEADAVAAAKTETTNQVNALKNAEVKANTDAIAGMDLATVGGGDGQYIKSVTQADGKVTAVADTLSMQLLTNVPTECATGIATCALVYDSDTSGFKWESIMP